MLIPIVSRFYNPAESGRQVIKAINKHNIFDIFTYEKNGNVEGYVLGFAPKKDVMDVLFYHIKDSTISLDELLEEFMDKTIEFKIDCISNNFPHSMNNDTIILKDGNKILRIDDLTRCPLYKIPHIGAILSF